MPLGTTSYGDNRFSLLSEDQSPRAKKKKLTGGIQLDDFPELDTSRIKVSNPKFDVITSASVNRPLSKFYFFAIYRFIQLISKDIISISQLRGGSLLLLVSNGSIANKFVNTKELAGICKVNCSMHEKLNITKATAPYLNNVSEEEIVRELKSQGVVAVYKFSKNLDGKKVPNAVLFDSYNLPTKIDICWYTVKVKQYFPSPRRCKNCQLLGHTQKFCKNATSCFSCNLPPHSLIECTRIFFANCAEKHPLIIKSVRNLFSKSKSSPSKLRNMHYERSSKDLSTTTAYAH